jgi:hypothetical protein
LVPRGLSAADVQDRFNQFADSDKFTRMTRGQAQALAQAGVIRQIAPKIWQLTDVLISHDYRPGEGGMISLSIEFPLQSFMETEMRRRPSWCLSI